MRDWIRRILTVALFAAIIIIGLKAAREVARLMREEPQSGQQQQQYAPGELPGMPAYLEGELQQAKKQGAEGLRRFLAQHYNEIQDPRLAEIELDYVVLVGVTDPDEARRVLKRLEGRIGPDSPLYQRFEALRRSYFGDEDKK